jgi:ribosomal protein S18 acetylase RimI-like enzyme
MVDYNMRFRQMSDNEFDKYFEWIISDYSQNSIKSGECNEENAFDYAKKQINDGIPQGKDTANNFFYVMINSQNEDVGHIWYAKCSESDAFICDFLILEKFREKGYGKQTLLLLENEVKEKKLNKIGLNVFKFNESAFSLYKCLGYKIFKQDSGSMYMVKDI